MPTTARVPSDPEDIIARIDAALEEGEPEDEPEFPACPYCHDDWHGLPNPRMWCPGSDGALVSTDYSAHELKAWGEGATDWSIFIGQTSAGDLSPVARMRSAIRTAWWALRRLVGVGGSDWVDIGFLDLTGEDLTPYIDAAREDIERMAAETYMPPQIVSDGPPVDMRQVYLGPYYHPEVYVDQVESVRLSHGG